ncbi:hypothetical protein Mp_5g08610 [Marchantia polymorpha subsp. ruderalis]|uniref:HAT C-terminal dimerisation domain-containing protein n=2 Tax=Marchantia polymorpha TaxID=3197 RepID=A0AAF6BGB4_MARPO|nr:hypothetical protein MARPO_0086s0066 [Marchantia polymorpha]BBN11048.1 hypothetical protein Mp_5g08610 [Marchantia polymorpha subsp. ruderalis]|eukprot:PTQ33747.1 hypothetical protein MARPO_0086s0066 [Marchantia polymorpha]
MKHECTLCKRWYSLIRLEIPFAIGTWIIGGGVFLCASRSDRFKKIVFTITNGYETPSTQTIWRRITELYRILLPMLGLFFRELDGFYVVTAHLIDIETLSSKSILLTIFNVECGTGVGRRGMSIDVLTRLLNVINDNVSDVIVAVRRLFQLINVSIGFEQMSNFNHVRCADHLIQLDVIKVFSFTKKSMEAFRDALVKIRRNKQGGDTSRFSNMMKFHTSDGVNVVEKRTVIDIIMEQFAIDISHSLLCDDQWQIINDVVTFLQAPRQTTLDLLPLSTCHLVKHCEMSVLQLLAINSKITVTGMREKIEEYEKLLVLEPAIVATYLNPQIAKPSNHVRLKKLTDLIRSNLQRRYSDEFMLDEVDQFLSIGVVQCKGFIDILSWWSARMEILPAHYKMAMDYLGTSATSTPFERVNSIAGREFTSSRQFLSSLMFIMTMCLRSWMDAKILNVSANRAIAAAIGYTNKDNSTDEIEDVVNQLEIEQDDVYEEVFDDGVVQILNNQFEEMVFESNLN